MSIIMPFGLPSAESGVQASTLPVRERILQNVFATLRSIRRLSKPERQSGTDVAVSTESSGAYTGEVTRFYMVGVTLGGPSGTAQVTVTDETPADVKALWPSSITGDDGPVAAVVTSGVAFNLGSNGVQMALTFTDDLVAGHKWGVWAGKYTNDVKEVTRDEDAELGHKLWIEQGYPDGEPTEGPLSKRTELLLIPLTLRARRADELATVLETFFADITWALLADETRGADAIWTRVEGNVGLALQEVKAGGRAVVQVEVLYRTADDNPYQS